MILLKQISKRVRNLRKRLLVLALWSLYLTLTYDADAALHFNGLISYQISFR